MQKICSNVAVARLSSDPGERTDPSRIEEGYTCGLTSTASLVFFNTVAIAAHAEDLEGKP
jgi:hypothetical protein